MAAETCLACGRCAAPYHVDCWHFVGRCSIFGCEATQAARWTGQAPAGPAPPRALLRIDESTRAVVPWRARVEGLARRLKIGARDLPKTIPAGLGGAAVAYGLMTVFASMFGHLYRARSLAVSASKIPAIGLAYGLVSPYLAPRQYRNPWQTARWGAAGWFVCLLLCRVLPALVDVSGTLGGAGRALVSASFVGFMLSSILLSSSVAEATLGGPEGDRRFGGLGAAPRMLVTWLLMWLVILPAHKVMWLDHRLPSLTQALEVAIWALLAAASGGTALETGKAEFKKSLPPAA